ncbi:hypothetical protein [Nostoc sp.]|uniref:hypothetical protein n=1 Tax=Nostoc sp. TaxID=1180 RepID=UPI002FFCCD73
MALPCPYNWRYNVVPHLNGNCYILSGDRSYGTAIASLLNQWTVNSLTSLLVGCKIVGLKQKLSPNKAQTGFVSSK